MTPVFGHGRLRLYLLSLLDESPKHGYELIQALSDRFGGTYSPSAGTIYPRLAKLEEEGLVTKTADGRKTVYAITEAGRAELESRRGELDDIEEELSDSVRRLADQVRSGVNQAMKSLKADLASAARDARTASASSGRGWTMTGGSTGSSASTASGSANEAPDARDSRSGPSRTVSAEALRDADAAITEFRQRLRLDLRKAATREGLSPELVARLKQRLNDVAAEVRDDLTRARSGR